MDLVVTLRVSSLVVLVLTSDFVLVISLGIKVTISISILSSVTWYVYVNVHLITRLTCLRRIFIVFLVDVFFSTKKFGKGREPQSWALVSHSLENK